MALEEIRLDDTLPDGLHCLILLATAGLFLGLGLQAPTEDGRPPAYQSVLLVCGLLLLFAGLLTLADVLGASFEGFPAGALVWTSLLELAIAAWAAVFRRSAVCLLIAAIAGGVALLSFWDWVFHAGAQTPYRWLLLLWATALVLASLTMRAWAPRHAEQLVNAAGLAIAGLGAAALLPGYVGKLLGLGADVTGLLPGFWELVLLAAGFGLVAFGAVERQPGPAYLGVMNLVLFIAAVASSVQETLSWWPLFLLAIGGVALAAGLRPRTPLPPEPAGYRAGDQPLAARTAEEDLVLRVRDDSPPR